MLVVTRLIAIDTPHQGNRCNIGLQECPLTTHCGRSVRVRFRPIADIRKMTRSNPLSRRTHQ
jgi:hypothetical protein